MTGKEKENYTKRATGYSQFRALAMKWVGDPDTKIGDVTEYFDGKNGVFKLITKTGPGSYETIKTRI